MSLRDDFADRLSADGAAAALCGLVIDVLIDKPVATYLTVERIDGWFDDLFDEGTVTDMVEAHARAFIEREQSRAKARGDRVMDWLSAEAQAELRALAARPVDLDRELLESWVDQDAVRTILRSLVQETLERFIDTVRPGGSGGGLLGQVGRGALGFASRAGRGLLGGIGSQVEDALRAAVQTFVSGSMGLMTERFVGILMRPETQRQMGRVRLRFYDRAIKTDTAKLVDLVANEGALDDLLEAVPGLIAHNLERSDVRQIIRDEVGQWLELEGERPIRSFLPEENIARLRADLIELTAPLTIEVVNSPAFAAWAAGETEGGADESPSPDEPEPEPAA